MHQEPLTFFYWTDKYFPRHKKGAYNLENNLEVIFNLFASRLWRREIVCYQGYFKVICHYD